MRGVNSNKTVVIGENMPGEITKIKNQAGGNILIFGSPSVSQLLMNMSLIDSYWIFINPTIFGKGIPLFTGSQEKIRLKLLATKEFSNGELALNYVLIK
jgi:dihydrofolate reductase